MSIGSLVCQDSRRLNDGLYAGASDNGVSAALSSKEATAALNSGSTVRPAAMTSSPVFEKTGNFSAVPRPQDAFPGRLCRKRDITAEAYLRLFIFITSHYIFLRYYIV